MKNSNSVIDWFKNIPNKPNHTFLSFNIVEFYPSITEDLLTKVISWAKRFAAIPNEHTSIIKHPRNSLLFYGNNTWVKKSDSNSLFDVTRGSYDGSDVCGLVGPYVLLKLSQEFGKEKVGLYRDNGLMVLNGTRGRQARQSKENTPQHLPRI